MQRNLLLAGLFAFALSATAQTFGKKPTVTNPSNKITTLNSKQMWLHDMTIMPNTSTANFSTEKPEPNRSIVVNNEKWCQTKSVSKAPDGTIISTTDFVLTEFGKIKKQTTYTYNDGVVTDGYLTEYEYDENHRLVKHTYSNMVELPNIFAKSTETTWRYNDDGNQVYYSDVKYDAAEKISDGVEVFGEYDNENNITMQQRNLYTNGEWVPDKRIEMGWDGNYQYMGLTFSNWDNVAKKWTKGEKNVSELIHHGKTTIDSGQYTWDADKQQWIVITETLIAFDKDGIQTMFSIQQKTDYGYSGHRWVTEHESPTLDISRFYEWSNDVNGWAMTTYDKIHKDENGNVNLRELYNADNTPIMTIENTWEKMLLGTDVYPDCYFVGDGTDVWQFLDEYKGKDMGDGTVEWNDITIKKGEGFKFASNDWQTIDWGVAYVGEYIPFNQPVQLTPKGQNITIDMETEAITFKTIRLNALTGVATFEVYPTGVNSPNAKRVNIFAINGKIVVQNAKDVKVYSASGELVSTAAVTPVEKGLYVVKAGGKTVKLNVK